MGDPDLTSDEEQRTESVRAADGAIGAVVSSVSHRVVACHGDLARGAWFRVNLLVMAVLSRPGWQRRPA
jgi:hypothetical protein